MKKLKLDLTALRVESFQACAGDGHAPGTVRANAITPDCTGEESCGPVTYCQDTCFCANTSPRPSCDDCSWQDCFTAPPECP
jgi:hypothetical protein